MARINQSQNTIVQAGQTDLQPEESQFAVKSLNGSTTPNVKWEGPDFDAIAKEKKGEMDLQASLLRQSLESVSITASPALDASGKDPGFLKKLKP